MSHSDPPRVIIVGGGPAGLTAAYSAVRRGARPIVFEKEPIVGGHARTEELHGFRFDIGGHRFYTKVAAVQRIWEELLGDDFVTVQRLSRIYYDDKFFFYPLRLRNVLAGLGVVESARVVASYLAAVANRSDDEDDFESWVINRFGRRLYETFFRSYTEKVWGMPCSQIQAKWAAQRIKGLTLPAVLRNVLSGSSHVKSLIREFQYPVLGPGMMWEAMADDVAVHGGAVHPGHEVVKLHVDRDRVVAVTVGGPRNEQRVAGDHFFSTMPLPMLIGRIDPPPPAEVRRAAQGLRFRDFLTVCVVVDHADLFPDNWIYVHDPAVRMGRLQNFKNWSPAMVPDAGKSGLGAEYFCTVGDDLWSMDDEDLVELASRELAALGLTRDARVDFGVVYRQRGAYPIYDDETAARTDVLRAYLGTLRNLHTIGRNGLHRYNNQDHSMLSALLAVDNMLGAEHDVWAVNADDAYGEIDTGEALDSWAEVLTR